MDANAELDTRSRPVSVEELAALRQPLVDHLATVEAKAAEREHVEVRLAGDLVAAFTTLIDDPGLDDDQRALLAAAIDYFLQARDAEDDLSSPIGFEDDAYIANTAFERLGRTDLTVSAI